MTSTDVSVSLWMLVRTCQATQLTECKFLLLTEGHEHAFAGVA